MDRKIKKFLCAFLSTLIIVQILPMSVWGADVQNSSIPYTTNTLDSDIEIVTELCSSDDTNMYLTSDGSILSQATALSENDSENNEKVIYPSNNFSNDRFKIGYEGEAGVIFNPVLSDLGNAFVKNAYVKIKCENIKRDTVLYASPISDDYDDYESISIGLATDYVAIDSSNNGEDIILDVTKTLNSWLSGGTSYGICIYSNDSLLSEYDFTESNEDSLYSNATICIEYRKLSDVDDNIESEIIDMGRAGTVYINDFNCAPTIVRNEIGLDGYLAPVQIQSILNHYNGTSAFTGSNFRLNYESYIDFSNNCYIWKTCEGEELLFSYDSTKLTYQLYTAVSSRGDEYTLKLSPDSGTYDTSNYEKISIIDPDNNEYHFNSNGFLYEILTNGNDSSKITILYNSYTTENATKSCISKIIDGAGRIYLFEYDSSNRLVMISANKAVGNSYEILKINNLNISVNYSYDENGNLSEVTYPDNESVYYTYDDYDRVETIISNSGNIMTFTYSNSDDLFVLSNYTISKSNNVIENISFDSSQPYRRVITDEIAKEINDNQTKTLDFDKNYNLVYLEDFDNKNYFLDYDNNELVTASNNSSINNIVSESNMSSSSKVRNNWTISGTYSVIRNTERRLRSDSYCLRFTGNETRNSYAYQKISGDFKAGEKYVIEGYASADEAVPNTDNKSFSIKVYSSDNSSGVAVRADLIGEINYQPYISSWQMQKQVITIPEDTTDIFVYLNYAYMGGYCYFDTIKLYEFSTPNIETDIDKTTYTYDDSGRLIKESVRGILLTREKNYNYNDEYDVLQSITENGITTYYNYDYENGLLNSYGKSTNSDENISYQYNGIGALASVQQVVSQLDNEENTNLNNIQISTLYSYTHDNITQIIHNGFSYDISYDGFGNISNVSINNQELYSFDPQYEVGAYYNTSMITYGDGTSLLYQESIDNDYYNIVNIFITNQDIPNSNYLSYTYRFKYDYDGTLVEYIDKSNETTSIWHNGTYAIYKNVSPSFLNNIDSVINGTLGIDNLGEIPIYQEDSENNIKLFDDNYSTNSEIISTDNTNTITTTNSLIEDNNTITTSTVSTTTDGFDRTTATTLSSGNMSVVNAYTYKSLGGLKTTNMISSYNTYIQNYVEEDNQVKPRLLKNYSYTYNSKGQISDVFSVSANGIPTTTESNDDFNASAEKTRHYEYDELGQLVKEVDLDLNKAILYYYDGGGNIVEKRIYQNEDSNDTSAFSFNKLNNQLILNSCTDDILYEYDDPNFKDLLTSYNGNEIEYDNAGNPLNYCGNTMYGITASGELAWSGKKLVSFTDTENERYYEYEYNADGLRTQKLIYNIEDDNSKSLASTMDYIWNNDVIVGYRITAYNGSGNPSSLITMKPVYDSNGGINGIMFTTRNPESNEIENSGTFGVLRDGLGNITDLYTSDDSLTYHFNYDAYGNCDLGFSGFNMSEILERLGTTNPLVIAIIIFIYAIVIAAVVAGTVVTTQQNYRGYLYDIETGLYYNQTRYYSPSWGRFINCDDVNVLTKDTSEVLGANLFKYCDNDPINYTDPSGFSKLSNAYDNSLLSLVGINSTEASKLNIALTSKQNTVDSKIIESSLALTAEQQDVWSEVFDEKPNTVKKTSGYNYLTSHLNSNGNGNTKLYNTENKSPYGTNTAFNNQ